MLVDSHCHLDRLDLSIYNGDLNTALKAAHDQGVEHILCVCIDLENFANVLAIAKKYPHVFASVGVHPTEVIADEPTITEMLKLAAHPKVIALGETGLDFYREETNKAIQLERFKKHIQVAKQVNKPLIVHTRHARKETLEMLEKEKANQVGGVLHCFTEDLATAEAAIELGFYISFSGIVTFQNAKELKEVAKRIPLEKMLVETDAPYLAPVPYRGKPNQPAYVRNVAEYIAELRGISFTELAKQTTENFFRLFKRTQAE